MTQTFEEAGMEELLNKGRRSGHVSAAEVLAAIPEAEGSRERLSAIVSQLAENGITVKVDNDIDRGAGAVVEAARRIVDEAVGIDDPVRMYLREIGKVPLLTAGNLTLPSKSGFTAIHATAETGQLRRIPAAHLTAEMLLARNDNGDTPLHAAAAEGHLDQIPPALLTRAMMGTRNYEGLTVAALARQSGHFDQVPRHARPLPPGIIGRLLGLFLPGGK